MNPRSARLSIYGRVCEAEQNTLCANVQESVALLSDSRTLQESQIRKNADVCIFHGRILTNPAATKHLNQTRAEYR